MLSITPLLNAVNRYILNPIIVLMFMVALAMFFWGIFQFISNAESDRGREEGKQNMLWGIVGMFIMISVYGIIRVVLATFGLPTPPYLPL
ncbi:MAG TPA: hypothetical protein VHF05_01305 [Candidatus Paceibacterota bacterium]|jgi:hypothetical protein|nr:hypothetical protein [Candidatus Paceibacterota bacterium]